MATILEFRRTDEAAARIDKRVEGRLGEIIIFPGIRIERHSATDAPQNGPSGQSSAQRVRRKSRA